MKKRRKSEKPVKKKVDFLWRLQKGNPVEWHDSHLKGTGKVVKPFHETTHEYNGKSYVGFPDGFYVDDDAGAFKNKLFYTKDLSSVLKNNA